MPTNRNIEFKAELRDLDLARAIARRIGARHVGQLAQTDTYFKLPQGRLKRRQTDAEPPEYILYARADDARPRVSEFTIFSEPDAFARFGTLGMPPWVTVRKLRDVFLLDFVRIHLDQVERLGRFIEFEALVLPQHNAGRCHRDIQRLRADFGPVLGEPVSASYSDLIAAEAPLPEAGLPPG
ncbi:MAG: class IV adenylate cyclase [Phycisphaerae bacterium]|nr:class IV adenylate cyclase [Phycisphaerae bacterium]